MSRTMNPMLNWSIIALVCVIGNERVCAFQTSPLLLQKTRAQQAPSMVAEIHTPNILKETDEMEPTSSVSMADDLVDVNNKASTAASVPEFTLGNVNIKMMTQTAKSQLFLVFGASAMTFMAMYTNGVDMNPTTSLLWNGAETFTFPWHSELGIGGIGGGALWTFPMIFLREALGESKQSHVTRANLASNNMVMDLLGRRQDAFGDHSQHSKTPILTALLLSAGLGLLAGTSQELVFRSMLPSLVFHQSHSVAIAFLVQSLVFGLAHLSPKASWAENQFVASREFLLGLCFGTLYLVSAGDLVPCIVAHSLLELHTYMKTWMMTNDQMDYTDEAVLQRLSPDEQVEIRQIILETGSDVQTLLSLRRLFYSFDHDRCGALSFDDVQRAVTLAFLQDKEQPSEGKVSDLFDTILRQRTNGQKDARLSLSEFIRLLFRVRTSMKQKHVIQA